MKQLTFDQVPSAISLLLKKVDDLSKEIKAIKDVSNDPLIDIKALSKKANISETKIRSLIKEGSLPYYKTDGKLLFNYQEVISTLKVKS